MSEFITKCPHCDIDLKAQNEWIGMDVECPSCKQTFVLDNNSTLPEIESTESAENKTLYTEEINCPFCDEITTKNDVFCKHCDNELKEATKLNSKKEHFHIFICPKCNNFSKFSESQKNKEYKCQSCGETSIAKEVLERICPKCGLKIKPLAIVCKYCKKKIPSIFVSKNPFTKSKKISRYIYAFLVLFATGILTVYLSMICSESMTASRQKAGEEYFREAKRYQKEKNYLMAAKYLRLSIKKGNITAKAALGVLYLSGSGVPQDNNKAWNLFTEAAIKGDAHGYLGLGVCSLRGLGTTQNFDNAVEYLSLAADKNVKEAQALLGLCYFKGYGVAQDYGKAYELLQHAANAGEPTAIKMLEELKNAEAIRTLTFLQNFKNAMEYTPPKKKSHLRRVACLSCNGRRRDSNYKICQHCLGEGFEWEETTD